MAANDVRTDVVETEIARGERDDVFEEYLRSERKRMRDKLRSKMSARTAKCNVPRVSAGSASARITELARPTKQRALNTLIEKTTTLSPAFVDNLIKIVEAKSRLTPEKAARVRRQKERGTRNATRLSLSLAKKRTGEIAEDTRVTTLDRDAVMSQYLMAERFVKSILEYRHEKWEDIYGITDVIMKRLMSLDGYTDTKNGDRVTQQLWLLADVVARWINEVLVEISETRKEALKRYEKKRQMRRLEVKDNNKTENWKQMDHQKKMIMVEDETNYEITRSDILIKEENEEEQKEDESDKEKVRVKEEAREREREQLDDSEAESESVTESMTEETVEKEKRMNSEKREIRME